MIISDSDQDNDDGDKMRNIRGKPENSGSSRSTRRSTRSRNEVSSSSSRAPKANTSSSLSSSAIPGSNGFGKASTPRVDRSKRVVMSPSSSISRPISPNARNPHLSWSPRLVASESQEEIQAKASALSQSSEQAKRMEGLSAALYAAISNFTDPTLPSATAVFLPLLTALLAYIKPPERDNSNNDNSFRRIYEQLPTIVTDSAWLLLLMIFQRCRITVFSLLHRSLFGLKSEVGSKTGCTSSVLNNRSPEEANSHSKSATGGKIEKSNASTDSIRNEGTTSQEIKEDSMTVSDVEDDDDTNGDNCSTKSRSVTKSDVDTPITKKRGQASKKQKLSSPAKKSTPTGEDLDPFAKAAAAAELGSSESGIAFGDYVIPVSDVDDLWNSLTQDLFDSLQLVTRDT